MNEGAQTLGERVRIARERRNLTQGELGKTAGTSQQTIEKIEKGITKHSRYLPMVLRALGLPLSELDSSLRGEIVPSLSTPQTQTNVPLVGERTLPVYGAVEGGDGALNISNDPVDFVRRPAPLAEVKDGYGFIVVGDSMFPELKPGDTGLVHPHLPPIQGEACVFFSDDDHGHVRATVKSFIRQTETHWHVEQWNPPKKLSLSKKEWQKCHRVVGKYARR